MSQGMNIWDIRPEDPEGLVKGLFSCIDGRDWAGLSEFLHDDAIYERPGYEPFVGKPAILDFYLTKRIISLGQHCVEKVLSDLPAPPPLDLGTVGTAIYGNFA